jgi:predicted DNA-binding transcriptional regulator AlpA
VIAGTENLMLVEDVAPMVGMARSTLVEYCRRGRFPHRKLPGSRRLLFPAADVQAYLDGCRLETILLQDGGRVVRPVKRRA